MGKVSLEEIYSNSLSKSGRGLGSSTCWARVLITRIMRAGILQQMLLLNTAQKIETLCLENAETNLFDIANTFFGCFFSFFSCLSSVRAVLSIWPTFGTGFKQNCECLIQKQKVAKPQSGLVSDYLCFAAQIPSAPLLSIPISYPARATDLCLFIELSDTCLYQKLDFISQVEG